MLVTMLVINIIVAVKKEKGPMYGNLKYKQLSLRVAPSEDSEESDC